jgi:glycine/D-amino acid oxidase-like deaminating enzyme
MASLYNAAVYDRSQPIGSYWETTTNAGNSALAPDPLEQDGQCDVAIIGGGITGLSAALHLAQMHQTDVRVLEAGSPAWGASGRNGGFCCVGATLLSNDDLLRHFGWEETRRFFQEQRAGVDLVRQLAEAEAIAIDAQGDGEIQVAHHPSRLAQLELEHDFFTEVAQYPCQVWSEKDLAEYGYRSPGAFGALHVGVGFGLNPLKYTLGLATSVVRAGGQIHAQSPVIAWEKYGVWHHLQTPEGTLRARRVIVATNGYTEDSLHQGFSDRLLPVLSNIITTRPLTATELKAQGWRTETPVFDTRHLLFYFRLLKDGRFLFGSRGGITGSPQESDRHRQEMIKRFQTMFPAWRDVEITHFWNGLVGTSANLTPHIGHLVADDPTVFYALAYHGSGVATATWSGKTVAQLVIDKIQTEDLCAVVRQPLKRFPLPALRMWYLRSLYTVYQVRDALP